MTLREWYTEGARMCGTEAADFDDVQIGEALVVAVADKGARATSLISATVMVGAGRDSDELSLDPVTCAVGAITSGVGYDVVLSPASRDSHPHGAYLVSIERT